MHTPISLLNGRSINVLLIECLHGEVNIYLKVCSLHHVYYRKAFDNLQRFLDHIISLHPSIKFTYEIQKDDN